MVAFHCLSCDNFTLDVLLPSKEKNLSSSCGSGKVGSFPARDAKYVSLPTKIRIDSVVHV